jgi:uncharacterized protein YdaU (DUF1376 family)
VNYYEHHIGDYAAATAHLSLLEDAVYSRLLRRYYLQEAPLPADERQVARLAGARTPDEVEAVKVVLAEFFTLESDGWHNKRADEEIARYQDKQAKARASAEARWGKVAKPSECERNASAMRAHSEGNAHQTPDTRHQTEQKQKQVRAPSGSRLPADWQPSDSDRAYAVKYGIDPDAEGECFRDFWLAKAGKDGRKADWSATWRTWIRRAAERRIPQSRAGPPPTQMGKQAQGLMALEAMKSGNRMAAGRTADGAPEALLLGPGTHAGR